MLGQGQVQAAALSVLRRADADTGAIADFVGLVEQVDNAQARGHITDRVIGESMCHCQIDGGIEG